MPGLMGRATVIVKSKFSKLLDRAENPNETLDYSYEEQLRQLQNVKRGIADVTTAKKRLELQYTTMQQQVDKLDGQARQALQAGREDLAREALARKAAVQAQLEGIMQQGQQLEAQQQKLIEGEKTLQTKVESFRTQKEVIKAQYSAAEAQVRIGEAATGLGEQMADVGPRDSAREGQDGVDAGARERDRRAHRLGRARGLHLVGRRHRPAARAALAGRAGRRRAREDEVGARQGRRAAEGARGRRGRGGRRRHDRPRARGGPVAGRRRVAATAARLDDVVAKALDAGDEAALHTALAALADAVRSHGEELPPEDLSPSDAIVPPADLSLAEARELMSNDGFIPDLPAPAP